MEPGYRWYDMHCHLDFRSDAVTFAREAADAGVAFFSTTVTPEGYRACERELGREPNVALGAGMHPWWVESCPDGGAELAQLAEQTRFVGEVGLDRSPRLAFFGEEQMEAFRQAMAACAFQGGKVISIHSVKAASQVLDVLEATGALQDCACIFHWFSDVQDQFIRAQNAGCWFSVGARMLGTRRGREYAKRIAADKLLLESDLPASDDDPAHALTPEGHARLLEQTFDALCEARGVVDAAGKDALAWQIARTSAGLLGL